jgi:hypothetical protein
VKRFRATGSILDRKRPCRKPLPTEGKLNKTGARLHIAPHSSPLTKCYFDLHSKQVCLHEDKLQLLHLPPLWFITSDTDFEPRLVFFFSETINSYWCYTYHDTIFTLTRLWQQICPFSSKRVHQFTLQIILCIFYTVSGSRIVSREFGPPCLPYLNTQTFARGAC